MNKPCNPASVGLRSFQLEDVERFKDAFKTRHANRGDARNSWKRHYGTSGHSPKFGPLIPLTIVS
jgi:hypothetical protein